MYDTAHTLSSTLHLTASEACCPRPRPALLLLSDQDLAMAHCSRHAPAALSDQDFAQGGQIQRYHERDLPDARWQRGCCLSNCTKACMQPPFNLPSMRQEGKGGCELALPNTGPAHHSIGMRQTLAMLSQKRAVCMHCRALCTHRLEQNQKRH